MLCKAFLALSLLTLGFAATPPAPAAKAEAPVFKSFTGRVSANKVRLRVKADLESPILRQIHKDDLLLVVAEEGDFYAVEPPKGTKAYVFRSYVLDDIVEANRVNVRLEPNVDAPVLGQLQAGDKVHGQVCAVNHKWLEIPAPKTTRFYVSKEFVVHAGGPEYISTMERRKTQVEERLSATYAAAEAECKKNYEEMTPDVVTDQFQNIIHNFSDFPEAVRQAKEGLALLKETYLNKKIAYLEAKANLSAEMRAELIAQHKEENRNLFVDATVHLDPDLWNKRHPKTEKTASMRTWDTLEDALFLSWTAFHTGKKIEDFYAEQKANGTILSGKLERYNTTVQDAPGNYLLKGPDAPIAYLYSTHVDLEKFAGKTVTVVAAPRPNHHFAFPAYFVLSVE